MNPPTTDPLNCKKTYSCAFKSPTMASATINMCNFALGTSIGRFDASSGNYSLTTPDQKSFPTGTYSFTITAVLADNPQALPVTTTFYISLLDPCTNPNNWIRGMPQTNPPVYTYTGGSPKVDFLLLNPFSTNVSNCPITYTCKQSSGPI